MQGLVHSEQEFFSWNIILHVYNVTNSKHISTYFEDLKCCFIYLIINYINFPYLIYLITINCFLYRGNKVSSTELQAGERNVSASIHPGKEHEERHEDLDLITSKNVKVQESKSHKKLKGNFINEHCSTLGQETEKSVLPSPSRTSHLTKTSKKAYFEGRKSPFASFGWNDSDRDIGQKKTYNVCAPENQVRT